MLVLGMPACFFSAMTRGRFASRSEGLGPWCVIVIKYNSINNNSPTNSNSNNSNSSNSNSNDNDNIRPTVRHEGVVGAGGGRLRGLAGSVLLIVRIDLRSV